MSTPTVLLPWLALQAYVMLTTDVCAGLKAWFEDEGDDLEQNDVQQAHCQVTMQVACIVEMVHAAFSFASSSLCAL